MTRPKVGPHKSRDGAPPPNYLPGLRVAEIQQHSHTEVFCLDCEWTQPGRSGYHRIKGELIRRHLAANPTHTVEAKMRGLEQFTIDPMRPT